MTLYRCPKCGVVFTRDSDKAWIRSYCSATKQFTRLMKVKSELTKEDS